MPNIIPIPNSQFQAPAWQKPFDYSQLGASIDNLFNAYQRGKMQNAQLQGAQLQNQGLQQGLAQGAANFQMGNMGLTPQDITQNMGKALQPPNQSLYANPEQQPLSGNGMLVNGPQTQQPPEDPRVATLRNIMQMHLQGAQLGMAGQMSGIEKNQAEAANQSAQANKENMLTGMLGGAGGGGIVGNVTNAIQSGQMGPDQLGLMGRGDVPNIIRLGAISKMASNGTPLQSLQNTADAGAAKAKSISEVQGKQGQTIGSMAGSMEDMLNKAEPLIKNLGNQKLKVLNQAFQAGLTFVNDPDINAALSYLNSASGFYATLQNNGNQPDVNSLNLARKNISPALDAKAFTGVKKALVDEGYSRVKRIQGQGYDQSVNLPSQNTVRIQLPNGSTGTIPSANLKQALSRGAKQIQ